MAEAFFLDASSEIESGSSPEQKITPKKKRGKKSICRYDKKVFMVKGGGEKG